MFFHFISYKKIAKLYAKEAFGRRRPLYGACGVMLVFELFLKAKYAKIVLMKIKD